MSHETDRDALARVATDHCHGIVTRDGEMDACGKPAVAIMDARGTEDGCYWPYWPACAYHANRYGPAVPLAQVLAAHDRQVAAAAFNEGTRAASRALGDPCFTRGWPVNPYRDRADRLEASDD